MSSNHNIHQTTFQVFYRLFLLSRCPKPAHQINTHREILHSLHKSIIMLLSQNRCRYQINDLFILLHRLKCCPNGNLCLPISDISADQTVHNLAALHILLHRFDRHHLILRLLKREHLFKLPLPDGIFPVDKSFLLLPCGIKFYQIFGNLPYRSTHTALGLIPFLGSQLI